jgi:LmbE family N-acetylglucosaminyl deacetylase
MTIPIIKKITKERIPCYFISPHLDDAALSAGELMRYLSHHTKVTVINVFTQSDHESTKLFKDRCAEDANALHSIHCSVINLGYIDAPWRRIKKPSVWRNWIARYNPDILRVYPTYRHIQPGKISTCDDELILSLTKRLRHTLPKKPMLFCPLGIGNHVDHLIVHKTMRSFSKPIYWFDQPYTLNTPHTYIDSHYRYLSTFNFPVNDICKNKLLKHYKTQVSPILVSFNVFPHLSELFTSHAL